MALQLTEWYPVLSFVNVAMIALMGRDYETT